MFNMESRHLFNSSVQNAVDCLSDNFNLKTFPGGAWARNSLEKCVVPSPDGCYRAHIAFVYYISRPPLSQNPLSAHPWEDICCGSILTSNFDFLVFSLKIKYKPRIDFTSAV